MYNKEYMKEYMRVYRESHRNETRIYNKTQRRKYKNLVLEHYGNVCANCGFPDIRALQLDHINNDGAEERLSIGGSRKFSGWRFYKWVIDNNYPDRYQILCANCNMIKELGEDF